MYTIKEISDLSGVTTRTLRYYDKINLLKPSHITDVGYRIYGKNEINKLQEILFFKELDFPLSEIKSILENKSSREEILISQKDQLKLKITRLENILETLEKSIIDIKGEVKMSDKEKFEALKDGQIKQNELKYGKEVREKYGNQSVDESYKKFKGMTKEQYEKYEVLNEELNETIKQAVALGDIKSDLAKKMCELHKEWLMVFWTNYTPEMHLGLANMYVDDERFTEYYDKIEKGSAKFLLQALTHYLTY